jgi:hypothetical protein
VISFSRCFPKRMYVLRWFGLQEALSQNSNGLINYSTGAGTPFLSG